MVWRWFERWFEVVWDHYINAEGVLIPFDAVVTRRGAYEHFSEVPQGGKELADLKDCQFGDMPDFSKEGDRKVLVRELCKYRSYYFELNPQDYHEIEESIKNIEEKTTETNREMRKRQIDSIIYRCVNDL